VTDATFSLSAAVSLRTLACLRSRPRRWRKPNRASVYQCFDMSWFTNSWRIIKLTANTTRMYTHCNEKPSYESWRWALHGRVCHRVVGKQLTKSHSTDTRRRNCGKSQIYNHGVENFFCFIYTSYTCLNSYDTFCILKISSLAFNDLQDLSNPFTRFFLWSY
jgi:hypothetical protein